MTVTFYQPYTLQLVVKHEEKWLEDLIAFILAAPSDSPIKLYCAVEAEHTERFPRPKVRRCGDGGRLSVEFLVPEPETGESLAAQLVHVFVKNGWDAYWQTVPMEQPAAKTPARTRRWEIAALPVPPADVLPLGKPGQVLVFDASGKKVWKDPAEYQTREQHILNIMDKWGDELQVAVKVADIQLSKVVEP